MVLKKITYEFTLRCEVLKIVEERSPYITLLACTEPRTGRILMVARENNVEKFDATLLEELEREFVTREEPEEEEREG